MKISGIGFVYMITCMITGKIYIGSTIDIDCRFNQYKRLACKEQLKLYRSFIKYGVKYHTFEVVWAGDINDMLKYESMIGINFDVLEKEKGLNLLLPKLNDKLCYHSDETRQKMSNSAKGKILKQETKDKIGLFNTGKKLSQESKDKVSKANKGKQFFLGKKHSEETKKKMSIIQSNRSVETKLKQIQHRIKPVIATNDFEILHFISIMEASRQLKCNHSNITACCKGKQKTAYGYKWKYDESKKQNTTANN